MTPSQADLEMTPEAQESRRHDRLWPARPDVSEFDRERPKLSRLTASVLYEGSAKGLRIAGARR
jgi:hypothetical protein